MIMLKNILLVGAGSFFGGALRYIVSLLVKYTGGFPTFSTFSKESLQLIQSGNWLYFSLYVAGSILLGLLLVAVGYQIAK